MSKIITFKVNCRLQAKWLYHKNNDIIVYLLQFLGLIIAIFHDREFID